MWHLPSVDESPPDPQDCHRQWSQDRVTFNSASSSNDSLPSALVPTAPPAPQDTWAQGTHKTDGTHWHVPVGVPGHRAAAETHRIPAGGRVL